MTFSHRGFGRAWDEMEADRDRERERRRIGALSPAKQLNWLRESIEDDQPDDANPASSQVPLAASLAKRVGDISTALRRGHPMTSSDQATLNEVQEFLTSLGGGDDDQAAADDDYATAESIRDGGYAPGKLRRRKPSGKQLSESAARDRNGVPRDPNAQLDWLRG